MNLIHVFSMLFLCITFGFASIGSVSLKKGVVSIQRGDSKIAAQNGTEILEKDSIETGKGSRVQIRFEDNTVISLGPLSEFKVEDYLYDEQKHKAKFGFAKGTFKAITGKIGKIAPQNFTLQTKTATIGIRGTIVVGALSDTGDVIGCLQGSIEVKPLSGGTGVVVGAGKKTFVAGDGSGAEEPSDMEGGGLGGDDNPQSAGIVGGENPADGAGKSISDATKTNLQENATENLQKNINDKVQSSGGCPANSVGTYPNCQPINITYKLPAYWTADLTADSSSLVGQKILNGYATRGYHQGVNNIFTNDGSFVLVFEGDSVRIPGPSAISYSDDTFSMEILSPKANTLTYNNINNFSIKSFDSKPDSWLQTENTIPNEYVSWGYWQYDYNNKNKLLEGLNFWVAGIDTGNAASYIVNNPESSYTYTGKSIGYIYDSTADSYVGIDPTNNNIVSLAFDFGAETPLSTSSYIQFQTNETTPEVWRLQNFSQTAFGNGAFTANTSVLINENSISDPSSVVNGSFYGDEAQAIGGSLRTTVSDKTAIGVFKAMRPLE